MIMSTTRPIQRIRLDGGRPCLDFINTVHRRPPSADDECLQSAGDFVDWLAHAGILQPAARRRMRRALPEADGETLLTRVLGLRERLYRVFGRIATGTTPAARERNALGVAIAGARGRQVLAWRDGRPQWQSPLPANPDLTLADPILIDAGELLTSGRLDRVGQCDPDEGCGWLFLDTTRNGSRRWCSMDTCGSAAKARAWYHRHRSGETGR